MLPPAILVTDTNIWIDLHHGGLLAQVFNLPYQILAPDFAKQHELFRPRWQVLEALGLEFAELKEDLIIELYRMKGQHRTLSLPDLSAFLVSRELGAILVTGDRRLAQLATENAVQVHGVLWILDEMVRLRIILGNNAARSLEKILDQGARLPREACAKRMNAWRNPK